MSLKEYQRKRNFADTPEPDGQRAKSEPKLRFVVQMHDATRLHYDLRLECDGVFKSWAVPKGPSLNPQDQRLAVRVEDHPIAYGGFEGVIPPGNYGAGTVMIWDAGTYHARSSEGVEETLAHFREGLKAGHITLMLSGRRLAGEFALVRNKSDNANPKHWLLVKKQDVYATHKSDQVEARSVATGRNMSEISAEATSRGQTWHPKEGAAEEAKLFDRVFFEDFSPPKKNERTPSIPDPTPVKSEKLDDASIEHFPAKLKLMKGRRTRGRPDKKGWLIQSLAGGRRMRIELRGGRVRFFALNETSLDEEYRQLKPQFSAMQDELVLDAEAHTEGSRTEIRILDILHLNGRRVRDLCTEVRISLLAGLDLPEGLSIAGELPSAQKQLIKDLGAPYQPGISKTCLLWEADSDQQGARLTHTDKVYFPGSGITKGQLVDYYVEVSEFILPYLRDFPMSLQRFPSGIDQEGFYQKDLTGYLPSFMATTRIFSQGSERSINYAMCQNLDSLKYLINLGCITLHPWFSKHGNLKKPEWIAIDLDPGQQPWSTVKVVARLVHEQLADLGIPHAAKTSGSKGIHIGIPTKGQWEYEELRSFCEKICLRVLEHTDLATLERLPAKRGGRLYLDIMQNRRGQTIAAPYSVRPWDGAPVSAPFAWTELDLIDSPRDFSIKNLPQRLKDVGDLWEPISAKSVDIKALNL